MGKSQFGYNQGEKVNLVTIRAKKSKLKGKVNLVTIRAKKSKLKGKSQFGYNQGEKVKTEGEKSIWLQLGRKSQN